jgi:hypothetical protein
VTASDLPLIYPDTVRSTGAPEEDLDKIASRLAAPGTSGVDFQIIGDRVYSAADQFELLTEAIAQRIAGTNPRFPLKATGLLGPDHAPPAHGEQTHLDWAAFRDATRDVQNFIRTEQRVPSRVFAGEGSVSPGEFLIALGTAYSSYCRNGRLPMAEGVALSKNGELLPARYIAQDTPGLFGGWIIHPEGFRAPKILEQARLQAWTLKPAIRH